MLGNFLKIDYIVVCFLKPLNSAYLLQNKYFPMPDSKELLFPNIRQSFNYSCKYLFIVSQDEDLLCKIQHEFKS